MSEAPGSAVNIPEGVEQALEGIFKQIDEQKDVLSDKEARWLENTLKKLDEGSLNRIKTRFETNNELTGLKTAILENLPLNKRGKIKKTANKSKHFAQTIIAELQGQPDDSYPITNNSVENLASTGEIPASVQALAEAAGGIENIKASKLLALSPEDLRSTFLTPDNRVDFRGNVYAQRRIGAGDLFPASQPFLSIDGVIGKRSADRNKVGYLNQNGQYLAILGGEKIELLDSAPFEFDSNIVPSFSAIEEQSLQEDFRKQIEAEEELEAQLIAEMDAEIAKLNIEAKTYREKFTATAKIYAQKIGTAYGIPPIVMYAQACLESGMGEKAVGNNFFGIKTGKSWTGKKSEFLTTEYFTEEQKKAFIASRGADAVKSIQGDRLKVVDSFRAYDSMQDSFLGYAKFLRKSPPTEPPSGRYAGAFEHTNDPKRFLETVISSGYATSKKYVSSAENMIRSQGLDWNSDFSAQAA